MKIVALSDTHWVLNKVEIPEADLLIFAGDWSSNRGDLTDLIYFVNVLKKNNSKHKVVIAGNHDWIAYKDPGLTKNIFDNANITYLCDSGTTIDGIKIWGTPWTPEFNDWAFMCSEDQLAQKWRFMPSDIDILVTHGPQYGLLDFVPGAGNVGSVSLETKIHKLKPYIHICGHIHGGYGTAFSEHTNFYNVSVCDEEYNNSNKPTIIEV